LTQKAAAYSLSDSSTPVLGELVTRVIQVCGRPEISSQYAPWLARWAPNAIDQYPNYYGPWMDEIVVSTMPEFDYDKFREWLAHCTSAHDFLRAPVLHPQIVVNDAVINGVDARKRKKKKSRASSH
jgi:hypothetical protein